MKSEVFALIFSFLVCPELLHFFGMLFIIQLFPLFYFDFGFFCLKYFLCLRRIRRLVHSSIQVSRRCSSLNRVGEQLTFQCCLTYHKLFLRKTVLSLSNFSLSLPWDYHINKWRFTLKVSTFSRLSCTVGSTLPFLIRTLWSSQKLLWAKSVFLQPVWW